MTNLKLSDMRKHYPYKNIEFPVEDDTDVNFKVEFVSDGNTGSTFVDVPKTKDKTILDSDEVFLCKGEDLRDDTTYVVSDISNLAPREDTIKINYYINDEIVVEHSNPKSEEERPMIFIHIKFPKK